MIHSSPPSQPHPPSSEQIGGDLAVSWGQVLFALLWIGSCGFHRYVHGAWPAEWWPLAYLLPAGIVGLSWDLTVGRAFRLRPAFGLGAD